MSETKEDDGAAFPISTWPHVGIPIRDWFAGQALAGMDGGGTAAVRAAWAYKQADAMLAARKAPAQPQEGEDG